MIHNIKSFGKVHKQTAHIHVHISFNIWWIGTALLSCRAVAKTSRTRRKYTNCLSLSPPSFSHFHLFPFRSRSPPHLSSASPSMSIAVPLFPLISLHSSLLFTSSRPYPLPNPPRSQKRRGICLLMSQRTVATTLTGNSGSGKSGVKLSIGKCRRNVTKS